MHSQKQEYHKCQTAVVHTLILVLVYKTDLRAI